MNNIGTRTELHTHLMGMLSYEGFLKLLRIYNHTLTIKPSKIKKMLEIPNGKRINYDKLNDYYQVRTFVLTSIANAIGDENKDRVLLTYFELVLDELRSQEIEYCEISYSNARVIKYLLENYNKDKYKDMEVRFLLSVDRNYTIDKLKDDLKQFRKLKDYNIGLDIMGIEKALTKEEMIYSAYNSSKSMEGKLEKILEVLKEYPNVVLRLHSGESVGSDKNTQFILHKIDRICESMDITSPRLRIGHGVHFRPTIKYFELLKKFNCIIEINATSNYALSNIKNFNQLPYREYLDNNIDIVICSDGHGLYDTTNFKEFMIALDKLGNDDLKRIYNLEDEMIKEWKIWKQTSKKK